MRRSAWSLCLSTIGVAAVAGCDHAAPFAEPTQPALGLKVPGPEALVDGGDSSAVWTADGLGIFFTGPCLVSQTTHGDVPSPAFSIIPASGGSISWHKCETAISLRQPHDSAVAFWAQTLSRSGRLLYLESVAWAPNPVLVFPDFGHADLWVTDSAGPLGRGHRVLPLYHDSAGFTVLPPPGINWMIDLHWVDEQRFVAIGANIPTRLGVVKPTPIELVRGMVYGDAATWTPIAGTDGARRYALSTDGATLYFNRDQLIVEAVPTAGGNVGTVATVPWVAHRGLVDLSCNAIRCLVLSHDTATFGRIQSTFWDVTLATGTVTPLRTDAVTYTTAKLSPTTNAVLVGRGGALYLFTDLVPQ